MSYVFLARPLFVEDDLWEEDRKGLKPAISVPGPKTIDTGLVTATGLAIHRRNPPIGFGRDREQ